MTAALRPPFKGGGELLALCDFLRNAEQVEATYKELETARLTANSVAVDADQRLTAAQEAEAKAVKAIDQSNDLAGMLESKSAAISEREAAITQRERDLDARESTSAENIEKATAEVDARAKALSEAEAAFAERQDAVTKAEATIADNIAKTAAALADAQAARDKAQEKLRILTSVEEVNQVDTLTAQVAEHAATAADIQQKLVDALAERDALKTQLDAQIEERAKNLADFTAQAEGLQANLTLSEERIKSLDDRVNELLTANTEEVERRRIAEAHVSDLSGQLAAVTAELEAAKAPPETQPEAGLSSLEGEPVTEITPEQPAAPEVQPEPDTVGSGGGQPPEAPVPAEDIAVAEQTPAEPKSEG